MTTNPEGGGSDAPGGHGAAMPRAAVPRNDEGRPAPVPDDGAGATVSQLRRDNDSGATGSKVAATDPAAVPLGTDAEAAGAPPGPALVETARRMERAAPDARPGSGEGKGRRLALIVAVVFLLVVLAVIAAFAWRS